MVRIEEMLENENQLFFCGIRDFISRNMSYFFQIIVDPSYNNVQCSSNDFKGELCYLGSKSDVLNMPVDEMINVFWSDINHDTALVWFLDFFRLIDFDIEKEFFPKDVGSKLYDLKDGNRLMLYRLRDLNTVINENDQLFGDIRNYHIGAKAWYGNKYKEFKETIAFSDEYVDKQINNDIMRFFYTEKDINDFIKKYKKR